MKRNRPQNSVARKMKRKRDEEEEEEEEDVEEEDMLILSRNQRASNIRRPCKRCSKISIPGNYGFCGFHRIPVRKCPSTATVGVQVYDALPETMSTRARYRGFLYNAQQRGKSVHLTMKRWLLLSCTPCAYCNSRGADVINGVDRLYNEANYTDNNCVPCCHACNAEKGEMPLRLWMNRKGRPKSELEATYVASLLASIA